MTQHVALVTGGSRGIGAAIVEELVTVGAAVIVAARGLQDCERLCAQIEEAGGSARPLALDVADRSSLRAARVRIEQLAGELGPVDWLVNNAGIAISAPLLRGTTDSGEDLYERHLAVNFHGPRLLVEALLPGMLERGAGRILAIASSAGLVGYPYVSAYCASKHALLGFTRAAALEVGPKGVAFGAICPHYVDSPMLAASIANVVAKTGKSEAEARAFFASQNPGGALVQPSEVAGVARQWLESGPNGAVIELDGARQHLRQ
ncbi:SDR family NAD(P)-dependent oxidoreductase [Engelhardtia mirabilis]|uniref:Ketoacyl reductase n=1 Tax=Engelhardtia mirabilis TaxID=2528011 RepID=A0A518BHP6_9BACT|nr:Putative ketoacyl reductase [Planctomycetes bacterium Pla133]QDV00789.1 Putative ketoacyl reductase [Planctomycetes bacterium Pla86]